MKRFFTFSGKMITSMQYIVLILSVIGAFLVNWNIPMILLCLIFFYTYGVIGMSMMLHRYFSHRTFEFKNKFLFWIFTGISVISARGSPIAWVHIHREHHAYADTDSDPHRPEKFSLFSFKTTYIGQIKKFLIKDLMIREHKIIHEYYLLFIIMWCIFLLLISPSVLYFAWILPVCMNQISQDLWNYFSHIDVGYRNYNTTENSRNVYWLWPLILGEAWHNNHHGNPKSFRLSKRNWEIDPLAYLINIVKK